MNVYILGAGFSAVAGLPTTSKLLDRIKNEGLEEELELLSIDVENFEELLSKVDLELYYLKKSNRNPERVANLKRIRNRLIKALTELMYPTEQKELPIYGKFVEGINPKEDAVISFNYDLVFEQSLKKQGFDFDYGYNKASEEKKLPLIKLHGSINHFHCDYCDNLLVLSVERLNEGIDGISCPRCKRAMDRAIIPPTLLKKYAGTAVEEIWPKALAFLQEAKKIYVIGYKIPDADLLSYQLLLFSSLTRKVKDQQIEIVLGPEEKNYESFRTLYGKRGVDIKETRLYFQDWIDTWGEING